ncbi:hypothetical protein O6H91_18G015800 [Diphasiastrum complanatum]|nr:hypothetical protein O6H91_18G015800 [Diphasiastrum complanatum]KAJ7522535.1 hypothetical protein O6H91_18G015800 [Diphasiastrum complanatum]KAJ7522536.1 hypothetical protein O6H91_18G015800 [Diphasiastrum complanatum]
MAVLAVGCGHGAAILSINARLYLQSGEKLVGHNLRCGNSKFLGPALPLRYHMKALAKSNSLRTRFLISCNVGNSESKGITPKAEDESLDPARLQDMENTSVFLDLSEKVKRVLSDVFQALQKPALVALCLGLLLTHNPEAALAASGGRMGGRAFSSSGSSGSGYSRSYSAPSSGFTYSAPYTAPSPFFGGGFGGVYVAPAYGVGIGGGGFFLFLILGFLALQFVSGFLTDRADGALLSGTQKTSVVKLQVGLLGLARSFQKDLDRLASRANTSTPEGLHYVLTETVLALLRHPDYCISAASSSEVKRSVEAGEERFNQLSLEERGKFDEETLVSVNDIRKRSLFTGSKSDRLNNEYIVVTILLAVEGELKLPSINSNADLKQALAKLGSVPTDRIMAVEVLWTPQDENDTLSERELLRDYPLLRSL